MLTKEPHTITFQFVTTNPEDIQVFSTNYKHHSFAVVIATVLLKRRMKKLGLENDPMWVGKTFRMKVWRKRMQVVNSLEYLHG
ncbi:MAG: hypothetical protein BWY50_01871 [Spirochaetes bacterium ADurb.Bin315]|nr:MAG: hypothetical protein BWY50_01871 [Spirochaetes bacterium ADurb.Bin315]